LARAQATPSRTLYGKPGDGDGVLAIDEGSVVVDDAAELHPAATDDTMPKPTRMATRRSSGSRLCGSGVSTRRIMHWFWATFSMRTRRKPATGELVRRPGRS